MKTRNRIFCSSALFFLLLAGNQSVFSQTRNIDSLKALLSIANSDTTRIKHLNSLSWHLRYINSDSSIQLAHEALALLAKTTTQLKPEKNDALKLVSYRNLAVIYHIKYQFSLGLDYYLKALNLAEKLKDQKKILELYNNMGILYMNQNNNSKALDYFLKAQKINSMKGDKSGEAAILGNIATIYKDQRKYTEALQNLYNALKITEELGERYAQAQNLEDIGDIHSLLGDSRKGLDFYFKALALYKELNDTYAIAINYSSIGNNYISLGEFKEAEKYLNMALALKTEDVSLRNSIQLHDMLSYLYDTTAIIAQKKVDYKNAIEHYKKSLYHLRKSFNLNKALFDEENKQLLNDKETAFEAEKKEAAIQAEIDKQQAITAATNRNQKLIIAIISSGLLLLLLFTILILRSLKTTNKQKQIIEIKNQEIELKNKDITSSIQYAKRIQNALLRDEEHVTSHLPEHSILFIPKDIVSGDFYWGNEKQEYWYFAVADCTGHGVPGAIMSMLGISFLNDILSTNELLKPADILNLLRNRVVNELRQMDETIGNKDGMDISLCRLNTKTLELQWAGANNPLYIVKPSKNISEPPLLEEIKADKQPIGYHTINQPFTNHEVQLQKGDCIYINSDGYADQFGGPQGKKFKSSQLKKVMSENYHLPMEEQKQLFLNHFNQWKGKLEQVDDVCVFGVRA